MNETSKSKEQLLQELEELRQRNAELSEELSFHSMLASMEDLIFVIDENGVFKRYLQSAERKDLYSQPSRFLDRHFRDILPPELADQLQMSINGGQA
jgi:PAS domain-containing protein